MYCYESFGFFNLACDHLFYTSLFMPLPGLSSSSLQAQEVYEDALSEGREAFLLEREASTSDIFTCSLGNIRPGEEATLKLRYVQALAPEPDGAVRFVLPAVLNPRYVPRGKSLPLAHVIYSRIRAPCKNDPLCFLSLCSYHPEGPKCCSQQLCVLALLTWPWTSTHSF